MLNKELSLFFTALMFYTRIPCPSWIDHSTDLLNQSRKYFPLIGWIVGGISAVVFWAATLIFPLSISVTLSITAGILATGAFHEDGFADSCDAFGGGWGKEQILKIMKDSRIGAFGMIGMALMLGLKFLVLLELAIYSISLVMITLVAGHTVSRFWASLVVESDEYVQDTDVSKIKPIATHKLSGGALFLGFLVMIITLIPYLSWVPVVAAAVAYGAQKYLSGYFRRQIGGFTGDCLGAVQQVCEVVFYLVILALVGHLWIFL